MLQRLARFCYRRRWRVLGAWVVLLVGLFALNSSVGGKFLDDFDLPGSESQEAVDLLEEHGFNDRAGATGQVVFKADDVNDPTVRGDMEALFDEVGRDHRPQPGGEPVQRGGRPPDQRGRHDRLRRGQPRRPRQRRAVRHRDGGPGGGRQRGRARHRGGARRRHRLRAAGVLERGDRLHRRPDHPADRVRLAAGSGSAADHRDLRHRHRHRHRRPGGQRHRHAELLEPGRGDDRHRRGDRLRPVHRHPLPRGPERRDDTGVRHDAVARHRRPGRALRGLHGDHRHPGPVHDRPGPDPGPGRGHLDRRAHDAARVAHPPAGHPRLRRHQHRQARLAPPPPRRPYRPPVGLVPLEPCHPAPALAGPAGLCGRPAPADDPALRAPPGVRRCRQPADRPDRAAGLRPDVRGLRAWGQRAVVARRRDAGRPIRPAGARGLVRRAEPDRRGRLRDGADPQRLRRCGHHPGAADHVAPGQGDRAPGESPTRRRHPPGRRGHDGRREGGWSDGSGRRLLALHRGSSALVHRCRARCCRSSS